MSHILIVDDDRVSRELLGKVLGINGHSVATAANGHDALLAAGGRLPDLVLLDLVMPQMDGVTFLQRFRSQPAFRRIPVIVLTAVVDPNVVRRVAQLGVRCYLLKARFSWDELEARIEAELRPPAASRATPARVPPAAGRTPAARPAAAKPPPPTDKLKPTASTLSAPVTAAAAMAPLPPLSPLTREQTIEQVERHTASKTLAGVVAEVIGLASSPRGSVAELVSLIKRDAVLATRVLQMANSAAFTTNKPRVVTVDEAVRNVGLSVVRNIATSVGIFDAFPPDAADGFNLLRSWQHSFAAAAILERITVGAEGIAPGAAHLVGLCHDLVEIVLRQCFADRYERAVAAAAQLAAAGDATADLHGAFGLPANELAALIVNRLALPPGIATPICEYADLLRRGITLASTTVAGPLTRALRLADLYAHGLLLASSPHAMVGPFSQAECRAALGRTDPPSIDGTSLRCEVLSTASLFARLPAKDEVKLAQPLYPRREELRVWYARHRSFSTLDSLEAALGQLSTVRCEDRLPREQELAECDAIVLAAPRPNLAGFWPDDLAKARGASSGVPALYLVGSGDETAHLAPYPFASRAYPLPLSLLAAFLNAAAGAKSSSPPAATMSITGKAA